MARTPTDSRIDNRTNRLKLETRGTPYYRTIGDGLSLGYRRNKKGNGSWEARFRPHTKYLKKTLADADDYDDANGVTVLTYAQALRAADKWRDSLRKPGEAGKPLTVTDACEHYLEHYRSEGKTRDADILQTMQAHILPHFGDQLVANLTTKQLKSWRDKLATLPARRRMSKHSTSKPPEKPIEPLSEEDKRKRRATSNRILTVFKATLNRAFKDDLVADDSAWRKVEPFKRADKAVTRFLTDAEAQRLLNACPADFRPLVQAALMTGARYGSLNQLTVADFNPNTGHVFFRPTKTDLSRHVPLNANALQFFKEQVKGKKSTDLIFLRSDGLPWGKSHAQRPLEKATEIAKIAPGLRFHDLRHYYASTLARSGVPLLTIAKLIGHKDTRVTERHYAHLCDEHLKNAVTALPELSLPDAAPNVINFNDR